jgi:diketogulonate reductase-like aldo/keto reductase
MSITTEAHVRTLSNGQQIPLLALGMWQMPDGSTAEMLGCHSAGCDAMPLE